MALRRVLPVSAVRLEDRQPSLPIAGTTAELTGRQLAVLRDALVALSVQSARRVLHGKRTAVEHRLLVDDIDAVRRRLNGDHG